MLGVMRYSLVPLATLASLLLVSCASEDPAVPHDAAQDSGVAESTVEESRVEEPSVAVDAKPDVAPGGNEACPYLDTEWVSNTNGQRTLSQGLDARFDPPACVFYSYGEGPHVQVMVRELANEERARAVVDAAAPADATDPAEYGDWQGGRGPLETGSVFAVANGNHAVVVWSDQAQSIKAEEIAVKTIENLGL